MQKKCMINTAAIAGQRAIADHFFRPARPVPFREGLCNWSRRVARKTASSVFANRRELGDRPDGSLPEPIDLRFLARFTLGNAALEREVLELFAGQAPLYLQQMRAAESTKAWRDAAHTMKGSAAAVGAWRLARFAEMAERLDVEAEVAVSEGLREQAVAGLAVAVDEACRYIARLFATA